MNPKVMLFDEPDVIVELAQSGMTMLCVTHEMGFARSVADRMIFTNEGEIIEESKPEEFFGNPRSERTKLFLSQILRH
jgi:general L-amino acid transport system ATP-binding protein